MAVAGRNCRLSCLPLFGFNLLDLKRKDSAFRLFDIAKHFLCLVLGPLDWLNLHNREDVLLQIAFRLPHNHHTRAYLVMIFVDCTFFWSWLGCKWTIFFVHAAHLGCLEATIDGIQLHIFTLSRQFDNYDFCLLGEVLRWAYLLKRRCRISSMILMSDNCFRVQLCLVVIGQNTFREIRVLFDRKLADTLFNFLLQLIPCFVSQKRKYSRMFSYAIVKLLVC